MEPLNQPRQIGITEDGRPIYAWPSTQVAPAPQAPVQRSGGGAGKWLAIGMGGSALLIAVAVSAVAVAVSVVAVTVCLVVLRGVVRDFQKGGR
ncbi:hypothetical protein H181DRAFT_03135 [Streptomyces sp. WMMB 714]|uniref:hypothetical protein n=1 Tax=Streptomyces sp. WMMB 714 TaxID=1286822 RepID=UPI0005F855CE|nr:hypothetical protein [Streptomyces sp. WMMB 714]SCK37124.1 hypothetical protein H181DRAFT_03135 [Streptomyces sp. WMMB 714]